MGLIVGVFKQSTYVNPDRTDSVKKKIAYLYLLFLMSLIKFICINFILYNSDFVPYHFALRVKEERRRDGWESFSLQCQQTQP